MWGLMVAMVFQHVGLPRLFKSDEDIARYLLDTSRVSARALMQLPISGCSKEEDSLAPGCAVLGHNVDDPSLYCKTLFAENADTRSALAAVVQVATCAWQTAASPSNATPPPPPNPPSASPAAPAPQAARLASGHRPR